MRASPLLAIMSVATTALSQSLPLSSSGRWILDADGKRVKLTCVNWAGHMETNTPEGLHKQSVEYIADFIKEQGFNCVRLTYSIDHALNPGVRVSDAFAAAAEPAGVSAEAMNNLFAQVQAKNSFAGGETTNRGVYEAVIAALHERGIMTILDNHVSKASWCCNIDDGNGWWDVGFGYNDGNSRFFKTQEWLDGLTAMATWAATQPGVIGMGLRNEVREWLLQGFNGRADWYDQMTKAAQSVHAANPEALILIGGTLSSTDLSHIKLRNFDFSGWAGKHVWEWHAYSFTVNFPNSGEDCGFTQGQYGFNAGFTLTQGEDFTAPLILSEFGFGMTGGEFDGLDQVNRQYFDCIKDYVLSNDSEWAIWAIMGSYYVRGGQVDYDEGFGVMNRDWTGLRNEKLPELLGDMFKTTQGP